MKILIVSDTHYPDLEHEGMRNKLFKVLKRGIYDVLIIAGDVTASGLYAEYERFFKILRKFSKDVIIAHVFGNHEFWLSKSQKRKKLDSIKKVKRFCDVAKAYDVVILDFEPLVLDDVGFVGNVGWYDYSFTINLPFNEEDYKRGTPYRDCVIVDKLKSYSFENIAPEWHNDAINVQLPFDNKDFVSKNIEKLKKDIKKIKNKVEEVNVVFHHVPKRELINFSGDEFNDFFKAYDGSVRLGECVEEFKEVIGKVYFGHVHDLNLKGKVVNGVEYVCVYRSLRSEVVEIKW